MTFTKSLTTAAVALTLAASAVAQDKPGAPAAAEPVLDPKRAAEAAAAAEPVDTAGPVSPAGGADACVTLGSGSPSVFVEGAPAADGADGPCYVLLEGSPDVFFGGRPGVTEGMAVLCQDGRVGRIVGGASSVFVNGRPVVTADARVEGCE